MNKILKRRFLRLLNFWPPLLGAGIRVKRLQPDWKAIDVEMKLRRWNANYVGTHYGGSLYSMADPEPGELVSMAFTMVVEQQDNGYRVSSKSGHPPPVLCLNEEALLRHLEDYGLTPEEIQTVRAELRERAKSEVEVIHVTAFQLDPDSPPRRRSKTSRV